MKHIALLRGINVGGHRKLPMAELRELFTEAGALHVASYIQSGNVVFDAPAKKAGAIARAVEKAIVDAFGFESPIIVRTSRQLDGIIDSAPFAADEKDPRFVFVGFLATKPSAALVKSLDPDRSPPDRFESRGTELFVHYPGGSARSKLTTTYFERTLKTAGTFRNWRTVLKLQDMTR